MKCIRTFGGVGFLTLAVLLGACNDQAEPELPPAAEPARPAAPADSVAPDVTIETGSRSYTISEKVEEWPSEMPAEVPRFASGTIRKIIRTGTPEADSWDMVIDHLPARAIRDYEAALKAAGFETTSMIAAESNGDRGSLTGEKGPVTVVLIGSGGSASLSIIIKQ